YLVIIAALAGVGAYQTWPIPEPEAAATAAANAAAQTGATAPTPDQLVAQARVALDAATKTKEESEKASKAKEQYLVRFLLYLGILGACIHAMTSVATYAGNQTFLTSWTTWYVLRPFIGGALAWLVFLVFRGGFLGGTGTAGLNPYAFGALGALSGLFSKQV